MTSNQPTLDASDASNAPNTRPSTPTRAGRKRIRIATPQTPSRSQRTVSVPHWVTEPVPFRASPAVSNELQGTPMGATIKAAYAAKAKRMSEAGQALADLGDYITQKMDEWTKAGLTETLGLASEMNDTVQKYCTNLAKDGTGSQESTSAPGNKTTSPSWASIAANSAKATKSTKATTPKVASPPPRLFARLPPEHKARASNAYATLHKLRAELPDSMGSMIREVRAVPSGIAIIPQTGWGSASLFQAKAQISKVLDGAPVEQEQKWQSYVIPNVARSYVDYTGEVQTIPDQQMEDEIVTQIGLKVEKAHWAKSAANAESGTVVLAVQENSADRVPAWISLFGTRRPIIRKSDKPRVSQCQNCWDYHNQKSCTRKPRCRLCGSREHTEAGHVHNGPKSPDCDCPERCTNCRGPHPANDLGCPLRPYCSGGSIQKKTKSEMEAIRKAQSAAFYNKQAKRRCGQKPSPSPNPGPTSTDSGLPGGNDIPMRSINTW